MLPHRRFAPLLLMLLTGCSGARRDAAGHADSASSSAPMLSAMHVHLDSAAGNPLILQADMAGHKRRVMAFVAGARSEMARLGMHSGSAYEALADSVTRDVDALASASGPDFDRLAGAHIDRVRRLMAVYDMPTGR